MESLIPEYDLLGHVRERSGGSLPGIAPSNTYRTQDGHYLVIAGNSDAIFQRFMRAIGRPELAADPSLARNDGRAAASARLDAAIEEWSSTLPAAEALAVLEAAGVPAGRIYSAADIAQDPHYAAREMLLEATLPGGANVKMPGIVPKLSETPGAMRWTGPALGQHTNEVLAALGYDPAGLEELRQTGVVA
jgi:crotonobetainyl-CoA:carnitine CoA-transferase CaiB-like acyl-CoA transferase